MRPVGGGTSEMKSIFDLQNDLAHAERELAYADYIDNHQRYVMEKDKWRKRVEEIRERMTKEDLFS